MSELRPSLRSFLVGLAWRGRNVGDFAFRLITGAFGAAILALFIGFLYVLSDEAWPAIQAYGWRFLTGTEWDSGTQTYGALPFIYGTLATSAIALLFAVPVAVGTAVALADLLPRRVAAVFGLLVELLAAIPSIIYGVWAAAVILPFVRRLGGEDTFGPSILAGGLVLAVMILPIITAISRDIIRSVPQSQRDAALALGSTDWEVTYRVVLPNARSGIIAAVILGFGRAIGETMAVIMVIGNQTKMFTSWFQPGSTIATIIATQFGDPTGTLNYPALVFLGLVLLVLSLSLNIAARIVVARATRRVGSL